MSLAILSNMSPGNLPWLNGSTSLQLTRTLVHFSWQGVVVAALFLLANRILRRRSANARYLASVMALTVLVVCPPLTFALLPVTSDGMASAIHSIREDSSEEALSSRVSNTADSVTSVPRIQQADATESGLRLKPSTSSAIGLWIRPASPWVVVLYLSGVAFMILRLALGFGEGRYFRSVSVEILDEPIQRMVRSICERWSMRVVPAVAYCHRVAVPVVIGVLHPMILLPPALMSGMSVRQLEALLIHEIAHIRRWDLAVNLFQRVVEALLFMHPAVWMISRRISVERENACDDLVIASGWQETDYVGALLTMADLCESPRRQNWTSTPLLAASGDRPSQLKQRVLRLLGEPITTLRHSRTGFGALMSVAFLLIATSVAMNWSLTPGVERTKTAIVAPTINPAETLRSIPEEYRAAMELFQGKKYEEARRLFEKFATESHESEFRDEALFMQAESAWQLGRYDSAFDSYEHFLKNRPSSQHLNLISERLFAIGRTLLASPDADGPINLQGVNVDPSMREASSGDKAYEHHHGPKSVSPIEDMMKPSSELERSGVAALTALWSYDPTGPQADDAMLLVARFHASQGNQIEARKILRLLRETFPNSPYAKNVDDLLIGIPNIDTSGRSVSEQIGEVYADVLIEGNSTIPIADIARHIKVCKGQAATLKQIKDDVDALIKTSWFAIIEPLRHQTNDGVVLVYRIVERPIVRRIEYKGLKRVKQNVFDGLTQLKVGSPYDVASNRECARRIEEYYHDKGFTFASVQLEKGAERDDREVIFLVHEGPKVRVRSVRFDKAQPIGEVKSPTDLREKHLTVRVIENKSDPSPISDHIECMKRYYHALGYFDVEITHEEKTLDDASKLEVCYDINEGVRYTIRRIEIAGNKIVSEDDLRGLMTASEGSLYNSYAIIRGVNAIKALYGAQGRLFCRVDAVPRWSEVPGVVDVAFKIDEDKVYRIRTLGAHVFGIDSATRKNLDVDKTSIQPGDLADPNDTARFKNHLLDK